MSKFQRSTMLRKLVNNSYRAIDEGAYETERYSSKTHQSLGLESAILSCPHAPIVAEIKFASPSRGVIVSADANAASQIATTMISAGAVGLSVLTQPFLFNGSIETLSMVRKVSTVPVLMKDILVSEVQIDAAKSIGADYILLIKTIFDQHLAEGSIEKFAEYAKNKDVRVIFEVHTELEFNEILTINKSVHAIIGINNRNLENLEVDIQNTEALLARYTKGDNVVITESGILDASDIRRLKRAGADAFLVGTSIMEADTVESKLRELYLSI
jgi:indole-3-glycerol phosphate synthase